MRNERRRPVLTPHARLLPVTALQTLIQTRDQLRLLAQLTQPQGETYSDVVYLSAEALANCFDRLADDLDRIAEAVSPSGV